MMWEPAELRQHARAAGGFQAKVLHKKGHGLPHQLAVSDSVPL